LSRATATARPRRGAAAATSERASCAGARVDGARFWGEGWGGRRRALNRDRDRFGSGPLPVSRAPPAQRVLKPPTDPAASHTARHPSRRNRPTPQPPQPPNAATAQHPNRRNRPTPQPPQPPSTPTAATAQPPPWPAGSYLRRRAACCGETRGPTFRGGLHATGLAAPPRPSLQTSTAPRPQPAPRPGRTTTCANAVGRPRAWSRPPSGPARAQPLGLLGPCPAAALTRPRPRARRNCSPSPAWHHTATVAVPQKRGTPPARQKHRLPPPAPTRAQPPPRPHASPRRRQTTRSAAATAPTAARSTTPPRACSTCASGAPGERGFALCKGRRAARPNRALATPNPKQV
jgi:hypothetical protein